MTRKMEESWTLSSIGFTHTANTSSCC